MKFYRFLVIGLFVLKKNSHLRYRRLAYTHIYYLILKVHC